MTIIQGNKKTATSKHKQLGFQLNKKKYEK